MCHIRDATNTSNHIHIGIYHSSNNTGKYRHNSCFIALHKSTFHAVVQLTVTFELIDPLNVTFQLKCSSVGRPINRMTWRLNNSNSESIFPVLSNTVTGTYHGILVVNGREIGNYSCSATDENGDTVSQTHLRVSGKHDHCISLVNAINNSKLRNSTFK